MMSSTDKSEKPILLSVSELKREANRLLSVASLSSLFVVILYFVYEFFDFICDQFLDYFGILVIH